MAATVTRPDILLKDSEGATISTHSYMFQAYIAAKAQPDGSFTIVRPTVTLIVTGV